MARLLWCAVASPHPASGPEVTRPAHGPRSAADGFGAWGPAAAALALFALRGISPPASAEWVPTLRYLLVLCGGAGLLFAAGARRLRGRSAWIDWLHVAAWLHPGQADFLAANRVLLALALPAGVSALLLFREFGPRAILDRARGFASRHITQRTVGVVLLAAAYWLAQFLFPGQIAAADLDLSWGQGTSYAFRTGLRAGREWLFTAGPYGPFQGGIYEAPLHWTRVWVWECGIEVLIAAVVAGSVLRVQGALQKTLYALAVLLLINEADSATFVAMVATAAWFLDRPRLASLPCALALLLLPLLAYTKFTALVLALVMALAIAGALWREDSRRTALAWLALLAGSFVGLWLLAGQHLIDLPRYLALSLDLSGGYSEAMALRDRDDLQPAAFTALALVAVLAALHAGARPFSGRLAAQAVVVALAAFIAYKAGFTRRDDHVRITFTCLAVFPFLLGDMAERAPWRANAFVVLRMACVWTCVGALAAASVDRTFGLRDIVDERVTRATTNAVVLGSPTEARASFERFRATLRAEHPLTRTRAEVGKASIDSFSWEQGLVLLHDLDWKPRLTIQGYCAYSPRLQRENAAQLLAPDAPEYFLFRLQSIDTKLPTMDDALVLQILARDYRPLFAEEDRVLLRRDPRPAPRPPQVVLEREIAFGERVDVSGLEGDVLLLALDLRPTLRGRLRTTLDQGALVFMDLSTTDGGSHRYRIVRGSIAEGAILSPLLRDQEDWIAWYGRQPLPRVASLTVLPTVPEWAYEPRIGLKILRADDVAPRAEPRFYAQLGKSLTLEPAQVDTPKPLVRRGIRGRPALIVFAPSELVYDVPPGRYTFTSTFGIGATRVADLRSDGVVFEAALEEPVGSAPQVRYRREVLPGDVQREDGAADFAHFDIDAPAGARLRLRTSPGPAGDARDDFAYWTPPRLFPRP